MTPFDRNASVFQGNGKIIISSLYELNIISLASSRGGPSVTTFSNREMRKITILPLNKEVSWIEPIVLDCGAFFWGGAFLLHLLGAQHQVCHDLILPLSPEKALAGSRTLQKDLQQCVMLSSVSRHPAIQECAPQKNFCDMGYNQWERWQVLGTYQESVGLDLPDYS